MSEELRSVSPADPEDELGVFPVADEAAVDAAVVAARRAFPGWRDAGFEARARVLRRFAELARDEEDALARLVAREVGKALWEARGEARLLPAKVEASLDEGLRCVAPIEAGPGARAGFHPRGVLAVLGPFNFPLHLPNGHLVPALATGNTAVLKPSEWAPACGERLLALLRRAGLPEGVVGLVQGGAEVGRRLATHPEVDAVLFTGSYAVGRALSEATLDQPGKLLALEMGGRNAIVVDADADLELAVAETAVSICATTGQRCSSASRLFVHRSRLQEFTEALLRVLAGVRAGPPLEPGVFMGPLIHAAAHAKVCRLRAEAERAGGERLLAAGSELPPPYLGAGLVRFASLAQQAAVQREEIFGPEAALYEVADLDEAVEAVNDSEYGLVASIFSARRQAFEHCVGRVRTGLLNWNRGTIGASGRLPFGGLGKSGNDRPAGIVSALYCTFPQATLEGPERFDPAALPPGLPRP